MDFEEQVSARLDMSLEEIIVQDGGATSFKRRPPKAQQSSQGGGGLGASSSSRPAAAPGISPGGPQSALPSRPLRSSPSASSQGGAVCAGGHALHGGAGSSFGSGVSAPGFFASTPSPPPAAADPHPQQRPPPPHVSLHKSVSYFPLPRPPPPAPGPVSSCRRFAAAAPAPPPAVPPPPDTASFSPPHFHMMHAPGRGGEDAFSFGGYGGGVCGREYRRSIPTAAPYPPPVTGGEEYFAPRRYRGGSGVHEGNLGGGRRLNGRGFAGGGPAPVVSLQSPPSGLLVGGGALAPVAGVQTSAGAASCHGPALGSLMHAPSAPLMRTLSHQQLPHAVPSHGASAGTRLPRGCYGHPLPYEVFQRTHGGTLRSSPHEEFLGAVDGGDETRSAAAASRGGGSAAPHAAEAAGGGKRAQAKKAHTVIVSNVPVDLAAIEIQDAFSVVGTVQRTDVMLNSQGEHTGRVCIAFETQAAAMAAVMQFDGGELNGNVIRVFAE